MRASVHVSHLPRCSSGGTGAMAHYSVSPPRWCTLPAGDRRGSPCSIIQTVKVDTSHCDLSGTIAWFLGVFPSSVHPPLPSPPLHSCPSGPVPISKPWGVDSSIQNWGFCCTSRLRFLPSEEDRGAKTVVVLTYRWASINSMVGCFFFSPRIREAQGDDMVHGKGTNGDLKGTPFICSFRVDGVKLRLSGWVKTESNIFQHWYHTGAGVYAPSSCCWTCAAKKKNYRATL